MITNQLRKMCISEKLPLLSRGIDICVCMYDYRRGCGNSDLAKDCLPAGRNDPLSGSISASLRFPFSEHRPLRKRKKTLPASHQAAHIQLDLCLLAGSAVPTAIRTQAVAQTRMFRMYHPGLSICIPNIVKTSMLPGARCLPEPAGGRGRPSDLSAPWGARRRANHRPEQAGRPPSGRRESRAAPV